MLNLIGVDTKPLDIKKVWQAYLQRKKAALGRATAKALSKDALTFEDIRQAFKDVRKDKALMHKIKEETKVWAEEKRKETKELLKKVKQE